MRYGKGDYVFAQWFRLSTQLVLLGIEAQMVIAQRTLKLARGGSPAQIELWRMTAEKMLAGTEAMAQMASGASVHRVVRGYRRKVQANSRRLSRGA